MIETVSPWCYAHPWVVTALCDLVTLCACMGIVLLMQRRHAAIAAPDATRTRPEPAPQPKPAAVAAPQTRIAIPEPAANRVRTLVQETPERLPMSQRGAVNRALDAMTRWEATYRPAGRGMADLARLTEKSADRVKTTEAWGG